MSMLDSDLARFLGRDQRGEKMKFKITLSFTLDHEPQDGETIKDACDRLERFYTVNDFMILKDWSGTYRSVGNPIEVVPLDETAEIELAPEANGVA